jgi:hypothetical protein
MKGHPLRIVHQMNPFERLAETLDKIPSGFPSSPGGEHLRVLEWIFSPQEAELASKLRLSGETSEEISARIGGGAAHLTEVLESMAEKGQISAFTSGSGLRKYALMPFVVGIYEEQLGRMDPEFAARFEDYFRAGFQGILTSPPSGFKVIPVNRVVNTSLEVHPFEKSWSTTRNLGACAIASARNSNRSLVMSVDTLELCVSCSIPTERMCMSMTTSPSPSLESVRFSCFEKPRTLA